MGKSEFGWDWTCLRKSGKVLSKNVSQIKKAVEQDFEVHAEMLYHIILCWFPQKRGLPIPKRKQARDRVEIGQKEFDFRKSFCSPLSTLNLCRFLQKYTRMCKNNNVDISTQRTRWTCEGVACATYEPLSSSSWAQSDSQLVMNTIVLAKPGALSLKVGRIECRFRSRPGNVFKHVNFLVVVRNTWLMHKQEALQLMNMTLSTTEFMLSEYQLNSSAGEIAFVRRRVIQFCTLLDFQPRGASQRCPYDWLWRIKFFFARVLLIKKRKHDSAYILLRLCTTL